MILARLATSVGTPISRDLGFLLPSATIVIGESVGSYRITAKLGEGGMGAVYLGEHQFIERRAAIKVLLPELSVNKDVVQRFFNEARATSVIRHPGIVEITDCAVLPTGNAYIVMELLEGESLGSYLRGGTQLSVQRAAHLTRHIADALAAAHDKRIVHRDLKPDNIFVLSAADAPSPIKILDFGIAKLLNPDAAQGQKTRTGSIIGTPTYMSPEQCRGRGEVDHRTDIYSLGCILFEMLCGRPPFTDQGFGELIQSHLSVVPPTVRSFAPTLPRSVEALVARMLAKSRDDRPQTMRDVIVEFDALSAGEPATTAAGSTRILPISAAPTPMVQTTMRSASGERIAVAGTRRKAPIIALAALALVIAGVGFWRMNAKEFVERDKSGGGTGDVVDGAIAKATDVGFGGTAAGEATGLSGNVGAGGTVAGETPDTGTRAGGSKVAIVPAVIPIHPAAARTVKVMIASTPAGADVCLAKDRILLGRTRFDWKTEKKPGTAKLLIRKRGYRGDEITVNLDHDVKKAVTLDKLGPDDIDDSDTCEKR